MNKETVMSDVTCNPSRLYCPVPRIEPTQFSSDLACWKTDESHFDKRVLGFKKVAVRHISVTHMLRTGEAETTGAERLRRMSEAGYVGLDIGVAAALWRDYLRNGIADSQLEKFFFVTGLTYMDFVAQPLVSPDNRAYVLFFCRVGGRSPTWSWAANMLKYIWLKSFPSSYLRAICAKT